jgi:hypothetical protein
MAFITKNSRGNQGRSVGERFNFQTKINHHIVGSTYVFGMVSTMHRESYHTFNSIRSLGRGVSRTGILIPTHVNVSLENQILDISLEFKTMGLSISISFGKLDEIHFFSTDTIRCSELVHSSLKSCSLALRLVLFPGVMVMHDQGPEQGSGNHSIFSSPDKNWLII